MDSYCTEEDQDFLDTADENINLFTIYQRHGSPDSFLKRSDVVYARSLALDVAAQHTFLKFECDIDGCVVELLDLSKVDIAVRHITFFPRGLADIAQLKTLLKKHLDLTVYSKNERLNFGHCVGFQLFYEFGWECWIGLIPKPMGCSVEMRKDIIKEFSFQQFNVLKSKLQKKLLAYVLQKKALKTLSKNDLNEIGKITVLPDDRQTILLALQGVLDSFENSEFELICFCFRFGEKMSNGLSLKEFGRDNIRKLTVHSAVNISSELDIDLFWSMGGLQSIVGSRGVLSTCLSFKDCGNFQSNLDGRLLDISHELRSICRQPDKLRFVQLYEDVPHKMPKTRFHPVSGLIAGGICFSKPTSDAFSKDAIHYISTLESNILATVRGTCRLEFVSELCVIPDVVDASYCIDLDQLEKVLSKKPLLVPLPKECLHCIRQLGLWVVKELKEIYQTFKKTGNISAIWRSYQFELAMEKLLWGHPLCLRSRIYSINLGPGEQAPSRSLTDTLGFLALDHSTSCMYTEDSIPSTAIWTSSESVAKMIQRSTGLHDHIEGCYPVIGRRLVYSLLKDLFEVGDMGGYCRFENFLTELQNRESKFHVVGVIRFKQLLQILCDKRRISFPMVYGGLCHLVVNNGIPLANIIEEGFRELSLTHFPAIEVFDVHHHPVLKWSRRCNFWKITDTEGISGDAIQSTSLLSDLVKNELERRRLIFASKLKKTDSTLPWICLCQKKLAREKLTDEDLLVTLAFVSCIAFIMQGWFVDFDSFSKLIRELPVSQSRLKHLEILSKFLIPGYNQHEVYRLHWSIPHKIKVTELDKTKPKAHPSDDRSIEFESTKVNDDVFDNRTTDDANLEIVQEVQTREVTCLPVEVYKKKRWTPIELEILHNLHSNTQNKSIPELYNAFKQACLGRGIPFRTFCAFEMRFRRL